MKAPHFAPRLFCVVICLDIFEKTGTFHRINAILFRKRPLRPALNRSDDIEVVSLASLVFTTST
jgi:hypothetical protein